MRPEEQAARWREIAAIRAERQQRLLAELAQQPDVAQAPAIGSVWSGRGVRCPCGGTSFIIRQWACKNGHLERIGVTCVQCAEDRCWDEQRSSAHCTQVTPMRSKWPMPGQ